jgi:RNA polymerase sigma-70 factor (ECF subfamily)
VSVADDTEAILRVRDGDRDAYAVLVEHHQEAAFRAAFLVLRDAHAAEDIAQEAFVRAYRSLDRFRHEEPFRPWLLRIVTNLALNEARSRSRRGRLLERIGLFSKADADPPMDALLASNEDASSVLRAIDRLKEQERLVLYLRYFLALDEREMSATLQVLPGTVKSRLHRASQSLREIIERDFPELRP